MVRSRLFAYAVATCSLLAAACSSTDQGQAHGDAGLTATGGSATDTGGATSASGGATSASGATGAGGTASRGSSTAAQIAQKLGRSHFLIGMGNDLDPKGNHDIDGAFTLGTSLDIHYVYLVGLMGQRGWPDWNANGGFVDIIDGVAKKHGTIPMFTLYSMAAKGENNKGALVDDSYMTAYWNGAKLLFQRLAAFDGPAAVQFEPDWWGYAQQASGGDPTTLPAHVSSLAPDCSSLPNTVVGQGKCLVALARKYAPKTLVGFHASPWADGDPAKIVKFLVQIGAGEADFLTTDTLDRDAGCYEAHTDSHCQRGGTTGWYWTDSDFATHLAWVKAMTTGVGVPMLWWQTPFGVPSTTPGGTTGHYRDNRVQYFFSNIDKLIAAGGVGALFGTGDVDQTYIDSDGDQFKNAVTKYFAAPTPLP